MEYDITIKYLIDRFPEQFAQFIIGRKCKVEVLLDNELTTIKREPDKLLLVEESNGEKYILHLEAQSTYELMIGRMIEYAGLILKKYKLKILPAVLFLREEDFPKEIKSIYTNIVHNEEYLRFKFVAIKPWDINYKKILESHSFGLYPLVPLMNFNGKSVEEVLKECISDLNSLKDSSLQSDIYTSICIIATIKYPKEIISRILEVSKMQESALYQEIYNKGLMEGMEKGIKTGIEKGIKTGIEKGIIQAKWDAIIDILKLRFDKIPNNLIVEVKSINKVEKLNRLHKKAVIVKNIDEFAKLLTNKNKKTKR